jgi:hypothetical protein
MFDHMNGVMRPLPKNKTEWKEDLFFAAKLARQKLSKYYAEVTPMTGLFRICAHLLDPFRKFQSFRKWDKAIHINPEDETSYTTQFQEALLKYVENEYCTKQQGVPGNKLETIPSSNFVPSTMASGSYQSSFDQYDSSGDDEEHVPPNNVAEMTPGRSNRAALILNAARLYLISPPEEPKKWGQINPNLNEYHSGPMEISRTFWIPDITDLWRQ